MNYTESQLQASIFSALCKAGYYAFMVPNDAAGKTSIQKAMRLKAMGLRPGVSDLVVMAPRGITVFLEVKTPKGKQSPAQILFQQKVESLGHQYHIVRCPEEALFLLDKIAGR
jgi:hypothetical protein